jgi:hypothetical protein
VVSARSAGERQKEAEDLAAASVCSGVAGEESPVFRIKLQPYVTTLRAADYSADFSGEPVHSLHRQLSPASLGQIVSMDKWH